MNIKKKKTPGRQCWSIHCREKINPVNRVKCPGVCDQLYCPDCIEIWEDGFRGCPQCITYEKDKRTEAGRTFKVKKPRISPQQKVSEQFLAMKLAYEQSLQQQGAAPTVHHDPENDNRHNQNYNIRRDSNSASGDQHSGVGQHDQK